MKNDSKPRRIPTITFQPDDDILQILSAIVGKKPEKGLKTKVLNASLRAGMPLAAEADAAAANARIEVIKNGLKNIPDNYPINPLNLIHESNTGINSSDDAAIVQSHVRAPSSKSSRGTSKRGEGKN